MIGKKGLLYGLHRGKELSTKATVTVKIGEILKNSIKINEATQKDSAADRTYVLIGCATDNINTYVVRSIVNAFSSELQSVDVLYAVNTKKETAVSETPRGSMPSTVSTVSITDLLDYVNRCFPEVLSADVLQHFGHESRPEPDSLSKYLKDCEAIIYDKNKTNGKHQVGESREMAFAQDDNPFVQEDNTTAESKSQEVSDKKLDSERDTSLDPRTLLTNALENAAVTEDEKNFRRKEEIP